MLAAAIKHNRLDVVEDVYENCVHLPRLATKETSTIQLSQCISSEAIHQLEAQIPHLGHLEKSEQAKVKSILSGKMFNSKK